MLRTLIFLLFTGACFAQQTPTPAPLDLVKQGQRLDGEGKQDEAFALYRQALEMSPNLYDAHLASGIALDLKGNYAEARQHLTKAVELAPVRRQTAGSARPGRLFRVRGERQRSWEVRAAGFRRPPVSSRFHRRRRDRQRTRPDLSGVWRYGECLQVVSVRIRNCPTQAEPHRCRQKSLALPPGARSSPHRRPRR